MNYTSHKARNKRKAQITGLIYLKTRAYPNATRHENFKSVDGELEMLQEEPQAMQKEDV